MSSAICFVSSAICFVSSAFSPFLFFIVHIYNVNKMII
ncbi:hypothetical protein T10_7389 [Trichinella papuae]|uniref:Uncharacterized protein n=1 Tax=Trichinella papuae TaxID=268474 RepID=A0A0V1LWA9_9BILA|nr:hypothetical protein T10_7389 [Trichinella papuae]